MATIKKISKTTDYQSFYNKFIKSVDKQAKKVERENQQSMAEEFDQILKGKKILVEGNFY